MKSERMKPLHGDLSVGTCPASPLRFRTFGNRRKAVVLYIIRGPNSGEFAPSFGTPCRLCVRDVFERPSSCPAVLDNYHSRYILREESADRSTRLAGGPGRGGF